LTRKHILFAKWPIPWETQEVPRPVPCCNTGSTFFWNEYAIQSFFSWDLIFFCCEATVPDILDMRGRAHSEWVAAAVAEDWLECRRGGRGSGGWGGPPSPPHHPGTASPGPKEAGSAVDPDPYRIGSKENLVLVRNRNPMIRPFILRKTQKSENIFWTKTSIYYSYNVP
jgi:hypothetical protein